MNVRHAITVIFAVSLLVTVATAKTPLRVVVAPYIQLQPHDKALTPCPNVSSLAAANCFGGWARANVYIRKERSTASNGSYFSVFSIDDTSRFVGSHPDGFSAINPFFQRSGGHSIVTEYWTMMSAQETRTLSYIANPTSVFITLSNMIDPPFIFANVFQAMSLHTVGEYKVMFLCTIDSTRHTYSFRSEKDVITTLIPAMRRAFKPDIVIIKAIVRPDQVSDTTPFRLEWLVSDQVDIVIGMDNDVSASRVSHINTTTVVRLHKNYTSVSALDWDPATRRVTAAGYREYDVMIDIPNALADADYDADQRFLQTHVNLATKNDPVIGVASAAMPGTSTAVQTCRVQDCEQGAFWTQVMYELTTIPPDIAVINGGGLRNGWANGTLRMSALFNSYPFADQACIFDMWGADVWAMFNYSVAKAPLVGMDVTNYTSTGRFLQTAGARYTYNSNRRTDDGSYRTRLTSLEVWNVAKKLWEPLSRRRKYRILSSQFICTGGDGYGTVVKPVGPRLSLPVELHTAAAQWVARFDKPVAPFLRGTITRVLAATDQYIVLPKTQSDCGPNTMWVADVQDCDTCPKGMSGPQCTEIDYSPSEDLVVPIVVPIAVFFTLLVAALGGYIKFQKRLLRTQTRDVTRAPKEGNVAVLFTDVQQSTKLWNTNKKAMTAAVEVHHQTMRKVITEYNGYEVKTIGDSFMVAHSDPAELCKIAVASQKALLDAPWPPEILMNADASIETNEAGTMIFRGIRVRMGIHYGAVEAVYDEVSKGYDYYGDTVNTAARVESVGFGGQILITEDVVTAAGDALDKSGDLELICIGPVQLKGITDRVKIHELVISSMRRGFRTIGDTAPTDKIHRKISLALRESVVDPSQLEKQADVDDMAVLDLKQEVTRLRAKMAAMQSGVGGPVPPLRSSVVDPSQWEEQPIVGDPAVMDV